MNAWTWTLDSIDSDFQTNALINIIPSIDSNSTFRIFSSIERVIINHLLAVRLSQTEFFVDSVSIRMNIESMIRFKCQLNSKLLYST